MSIVSSYPHGMTKLEMNQLTRQISVMQSYSTGKQVEELYIYGDDLYAWNPSIEPNWDWESFDYRIAEIQTELNEDDFIHNSVDDIIEPIARPSGLRIKKKVVKEQIELPQDIQNQSDELIIKLKQIDDDYNERIKSKTWMQFFKSIFK